MGESLHYTFTKSERLTNVKLIESVFSSTENIKSFPVIFIHYSFDLEGTSNFQVLFSVSKRKYKRAVDRNRIKRLMRESFRLQKSLFIEALGKRKIIGAFVYTNKVVCDYPTIYGAISKIILQLKNSNISE